MSQPAYPLVSIITLTWNTTEITADFLRSINEVNTYPNLEVIVVDNGSREDPTPALSAIYPAVRVIRNERNLGFTGGNNVGFRHARGDYFFVVNNDTEFTPALIEGLLEVFRTHPDAGMVSPKFHYFFSKGTIEYAGYQPVNIFTGRNAMIGCREPDNGQYNELRPTHYAHGGGVLVTRQVIDQGCYFDETFFNYYEELDWCERIKKKGFKIYYQPNSLIYHKESMTNGKNSPAKTFYLTKNRILYMRRNVHWPGFLVFMTYFVFFTVPKNSISFLLKGQKSHLRSFWKGILWHFNENRSVIYN